MDVGSSKTQSHIGRIPRSASKGTVICLYVLALIAAGLRTVIRLRFRKLQWLDDGFIFLAILFMTTSFGIFLGFFNDLYDVETFIYDPFSAGDALSNLIPVAKRVQLYTVAYIIISISGIFSVKFSFLFFFRNLLSRIRPLVLYWRGVLTFTAIAWAFSIGFSVYGCPYVDGRSLSCAQGTKLGKAIDTSVVLTVFDISSDLLIISVPIFVLKRVKLPWRKKLYLGCSLCLSAVMIVVATLQAATLTYMSVPAIDVVWEIYFQFVELTIAVIVVSVTAFQIFFVQQASHSSQGSSSWRPSWCKNQKFKKIWDKIWPSTSTEGLKYKKVWNKLWPSSSTEESNAPWLDPQIPRAEMTGIRSIIDRAADSPWLNSGKRGIGQSHELREMQPPKQAHVEPARYTMSTIDLKKEYNDMQRELQKKLPPSKPLYLNALQMNTSTMEVGEPSSAQREMPISSLDSSFKTAKPKQFPSVSPTRDQRSKVGIPMERPQLQPAKPRIPPIPKTGVSPLGPDSDGINFSETSRPFGEPSKQQPPPSESKSASGPVNAQSHHPLSAHPIPSPLFWDDRPLPPTPAANPAVRIEYFLRSPKSSENFPRQRSVGTRESEPSTARRPPRRSEEELLLRESGLQRAIKTSFEMASDPRPRVEESWFSDQG